MLSFILIFIRHSKTGYFKGNSVYRKGIGLIEVNVQEPFYPGYRFIKLLIVISNSSNNAINLHFLPCISQLFSDSNEDIYSSLKMLFRRLLGIHIFLVLHNVTHLCPLPPLPPLLFPSSLLKDA